MQAYLSSGEDSPMKEVYLKEGFRENVLNSCKKPVVFFSERINAVRSPKPLQKEGEMP